MFDVNPEIIERTLESAWHSETLEHYQEDEEYYSLDFSKEEDVRFAIRKWLKVEDKDSINWRNNEKLIYKESLRYVITKYGYLNADVWLPSIDYIPIEGIHTEIHAQEFERLYRNFLLILWDEWFNEPFIEANLSHYRVRIDREFILFPHMPELWNKPIYAPLPKAI